jgi:hypothetical protein
MLTAQVKLKDTDMFEMKRSQSSKKIFFKGTIIEKRGLIMNAEQSEEHNSILTRRPSYLFIR